MLEPETAPRKTKIVLVARVFVIIVNCESRLIRESRRHVLKNFSLFAGGRGDGATQSQPRLCAPAHLVWRAAF